MPQTFPVIRHGILTQVSPNRQVIVIDPQQRRAFVIEGLAADIWLMLDDGQSQSKIEDFLLNGRDLRHQKKRKEELKSFYEDLARHQLVESQSESSTAFHAKPSKHSEEK